MKQQDKSIKEALSEGKLDPESLIRKAMQIAGTSRCTTRRRIFSAWGRGLIWMDSAGRFEWTGKEEEP